MTCGFTKTHDGLDLDLLIFMSGEVQQKIQHFVLDDNLRDTWRASPRQVTTCLYGGCKDTVGTLCGYFTLLAPLNSSWSKSKCRQRAPTVKSERSSVGLFVTSVELFGSSWC